MEAIRGAGSGERVRTVSQFTGNEKIPIEGIAISPSGEAAASVDVCTTPSSFGNAVDNHQKCSEQCPLLNAIDSADEGCGDISQVDQAANLQKSHISQLEPSDDSSYMSSSRSSVTSSPRGHHVCCGQVNDIACKVDQELRASHEDFVDLPIIPRDETSPPPPPPTDLDISREMTRLSISRTLTHDVEPCQIASCSHSLPPKSASPPPPKNTPEKTPSRMGVEDTEEPIGVRLDLAGMLREQYIREYYGHEADASAALEDSGSDILYGSDIIDVPGVEDTSEPEEKKIGGTLGRVWSKIRAGRSPSQSKSLPPSAPALPTRKSSSLLSRMFSRSATNTSGRFHDLSDSNKTLPRALWGAASAAAVVVAVGDGATDADTDALFRPVDPPQASAKLAPAPKAAGSRSVTESASQTDECGTWIHASQGLSARPSLANYGVLRRLGGRWLLMARRRGDHHCAAAVD